MQTETTHDTGAGELARWRQDQLIRSGFERSLAVEIADNPRYDLHAVLDLVERGCPPGLAGRILAPLEDDAA